MTKIKNFLAAFTLILSFILSLSSCGGDDEPDDLSVGNSNVNAKDVVGIWEITSATDEDGSKIEMWEKSWGFYSNGDFEIIYSDNDSEYKGTWYIRKDVKGQIIISETPFYINIKSGKMQLQTVYPPKINISLTKTANLPD